MVEEHKIEKVFITEDDSIKTWSETVQEGTNWS